MKPPAPLPVADWPAVRAALVARIDRIEGRMTAASERASAVAYAANPELDVGGIRSRTARQRARETATYDRAGRIVVEGVREVRELRSLVKALDEAVRLGDAMVAKLASGEMHGRPMTAEERSAARSLVISYGRTMRRAIVEARR